MANKIPNTCFNEFETAKSVMNFELSRRDMIRRDFSDKRYLEYFILLSKYMINQNKNYDEIQSFLRKYTSLCLYYSYIYYYILKNKNDLNFYEVSEFNSILDKDSIDIDAFEHLDLSGYNANPFAILYSPKDYKDISYSQKILFDNIEKVESNQIKLSYLYKCFYDYFYYNCRFKNNPVGVYGHNDLSIVYCLNHPKLDSFTFEPLDNNYKKYLIKKNPSDSETKFNIPLLGYIINIIFENDNLNFDKDMYVRSDYYYNIMLSRARGKTIRELFKFFIHIDNNKAYIKKDSIDKSFTFLYNGTKYIFSKNGIEKL